MTFVQYIEIIKESVASEGYNQFFPSLCASSSDSEDLSILICELRDAGEEALAKDWAATFLKSTPHVFLAYRSGSRHVDVCEIRGHEVVDKVRILVK